MTPPPKPPDTASFPLSHAVALGVLQGPAELLPVSSSGHLALVPTLLGWPYDRLDPELRKAFEVALHAGTAAALLIVLRREVREVAEELDSRRAIRLILTFLPPAIAAALFERTIERRLGGVRSVAWAQVAGGAVLNL
ncbi:MAG: undecaprenyl-diphosphate phosphatase, partial [Thermoleophilaceae bacterium]|nr:undecaprenyl-diphosphate phosphatase [Thermoleophilaceae bacterium]